MRDNEIMLHIRVPLEMHQRLAMMRALTRQSMTAIVNKAVAELMAKESEKESAAA